MRHRRPPPPKREWAYFFDLDGTLIDFAPTPSAVRVGENVRVLLERLYRATGGAVALISGRPITEVDRLFSHVRLPVAGQHGLERRTAAGRILRHAVPTRRFERVRLRLANAVHGKAGLLLENKGLSLALHYRRAPRLGAYAHRLARSMLPVVGHRFCIQRGKYVVEMRPAGRDKGMGILEFMKEPPFRGRTPVFVGDDATDEFGFATVNRLRGHSIKVGSGRTAAQWRLPNVHAVQDWLAS
ncbi:MAG TPA: trehalose-phosphatase [Gemmatimonadales bacterium]|nr:trehalose-phosphatase [Gemmatimonadales bacterium]